MDIGNFVSFATEQPQPSNPARERAMEEFQQYFDKNPKTMLEKSSDSRNFETENVCQLQQTFSSVKIPPPKLVCEEETELRRALQLGNLDEARRIMREIATVSSDASHMLCTPICDTVSSSEDLSLPLSPLKLDNLQHGDTRLFYVIAEDVKSELDLSPSLRIADLITEAEALLEFRFEKQTSRQKLDLILRQTQSSSSARFCKVISAVKTAMNFKSDLKTVNVIHEV